MWQSPGQRLDPRYVVSIDRSRRITCGMWGWISAFGPGELIEIPPRMDGPAYVNILENVFLPSARALFPAKEVPVIRLVQDNSAVHTSFIVRQWFAQHPEIHLLDWPAKSPDLNLIENVWSEMGRRWVPGRERTRSTLLAHAQIVWEDLRSRPEYFASLRRSIPNRLSSVIDNNGYWTNY